jgi:putative NADH-flavin reductase
MPTKRILVLGATGGTGKAVVAQALALGHEVTVFVRDPNRLESNRGRLRVLVGDVTDAGDAIRAATRDQDAVVSALGLGRSLTSHGLIARSIPIIVRAMEADSVRRLIFMSAYGVGATYRDTPLLPRILTRTLLKDMYADKNAGEDELRRIGDGIDWTIVYPVTLTDGPETGRFRFGERLDLRGLPKIARADVAQFMLTQLDDATYSRKGVLVSS